jgi:hypothetical protein
MNIYCVQGHGIEVLVPFDNRRVVPEGYTLVLFADTAMEVESEIFCQFMDLFNTRTQATFDLLSQPDVHRRALLNKFRRIRIYTAGMKMPKLITSLFVKDKPDKNDMEPVTIYEKSGVYDHKIGIPWINQTTSSAHCTKYQIPAAGFSPSIYNTMYQGSIAQKPYNADLAAMDEKDIDVFDIMKRCGHGIYYYGGCRWVPSKEQYEQLYLGIYDQLRAFLQQHPRVGTGIPSFQKSLNAVFGHKPLNLAEKRSPYYEPHYKTLATYVMNSQVADDDIKMQMKEFLGKISLHNRENHVFQKSSERQRQSEQKTYNDLLLSELARKNLRISG